MEANPIGTFESCWRQKNGTPRQGCLVPSSKGIVHLTLGGNGHQAVEGLEEFSHVWLIFHFHDNGANSKPHLKVAPPRLNGVKVGVFASRSPHRPNAIGITVAKLDRIEGTDLHVSGVDLINGTPILDVKPYIEQYDCIPDARVANWVAEDAKEKPCDVVFLPEAEQQLIDCMRYVKLYDDVAAVREGIVDVLREEPRSVYWRTNCKDIEYGFCIDALNVRCKFEPERIVVFVVEYWPPGMTKSDSVYAITGEKKRGVQEDGAGPSNAKRANTDDGASHVQHSGGNETVDPTVE